MIGKTSQYETTELKFAALVIAEIPDCSLEIITQPNSIRKIICIKYPSSFQPQISILEKDFINKVANANVYLYNKALNEIRDKLREEVKENGIIRER